MASTRHDSALTGLHGAGGLTFDPSVRGSYDRYLATEGQPRGERPASAFYMAEELSKRGLAYLHLNEPNWAGGDITFPDGFREQMRERFSGSLIYCGNYDAERAEARIKENTADAVAFGRPYIANPDLPERFRVNAPLTEPNHETFYGGDEKGYTDYPFLNNGYDRIG